MSQHDDLFQELGRTLDVAPSRDFASGVRSRIARRRLVMRTTMSGLAIAASLLLVVIAQWPEPADPIAIQPAESALAERSPRALAPALHQAPDSAEHTRAERSPRALALGTPTPVADTDRLHVVTNQMAVLRAVWANQQVTAGETEAPVVEELPTTGPAPVVIEPVRVLPVVIVDNRAPTEGLPVIRRAVAALETK